MFLLFPNNLFLNLKKEYKYILYEHPLFFNDNRRSKLFHIQKLILHRASMKYYYNLMKNKGYDISYVNFKDNLNKKNIKDIFDPCDKLLEKEFKKCNIHKSPMFLHSIEDLNEYNGGLFHHTFKNWSIKKLNLKDLDKSYDNLNRNKLKDIENVPNYNFKTKNNEYIKEAINYVKQFKTYGIFKTDFKYPITHKEAYDNLIDFIKNRFDFFGKYQDSIINNNEKNILYHSCLSSSLNIGLITPKEIIDEIIKIKNKIKIENYEGFLRQIIGWREYMRYCYLFYYDEIIKSNFFDNNNKLPIEWYNNDFKTGIEPIDNCIIKVVNTAYLHHIERLMIILNYMTLLEINSFDIYKWFLSCVSIDAYDWVMITNIYIFSYSFNKASRKPYISSSNYILKMSNYTKNEWCNKWDQLYKNFLKKKKDKLKGTIYYIQAIKL
jgi:deoxyribodipyrimidine photolyase-related protein